VDPRHPYGGDLVFTAFSGSHQDAIKKGLAERARQVGDGEVAWDVPYLPIDPLDVGRTYDAVIRVNSQSGKGGIAYLLERDYGLSLPRLLQIEFSQVIQQVTDATGKELPAAEIHAIFNREYVVAAEPVAYVDHRTRHGASGTVEHLTARLRLNGVETTLEGSGNGPVDAFVRALRDGAGLDIHVQNYHEHGVGSGEDATAVAYVQLRIGADRTVYGVGLDPNIVTATLRAVVSAVNRGVQREWLALPPEKRLMYA
jgi:2-isopropylmalate synthase